MATITPDAQGPGKGGRRPGFFKSPRPMLVVTGKFSFDTSYPTGGEDITDIFSEFKECLGIVFADPTGSAGTGKNVIVDYTNKKALLYDNAATPAQVTNASDQSGAADLRYMAWGYAG